MLNYIEDISENLNKDYRKAGQRNAINIAFFDVS